MAFDSPEQFLLMNGHGIFVWISYGVWFASTLGLWWASRLSRRKALRVVLDYWEEMAEHE